MGDVADDAFDAAWREQLMLDAAMSAGLKPCPDPHTEDRVCPICADLGWIDQDGNPADL